MNTLLPLTLLLSAGPAWLDPVQSVEIARLVRQLGSDNFEQREQATRPCPCFDGPSRATTWSRAVALRISFAPSSAACPACAAS
jgi:hypothetical protein